MSAMADAQRFGSVCVYGAGAIGGMLAARFATAEGLAGSRFSVVARGAHLAAIRRSGLRLTPGGGGKPVIVQVAATDDPALLGPQDLVVSTLKGHQLPAAAPGIAALLGPNTRVVTILNGIPWWYAHGDTGGRGAGDALAMLDPDGALHRLVGPERVIGCVAYSGAEVPRPGEVVLTVDRPFILGEPSGEATGDLAAVAALFRVAGCQVETTGRIREAIWSKLMGNSSFNPISTLSRARLSDIVEDPALLEVARQVMAEVRAVGTAMGARDLVEVDIRMGQARGMGGIKSSMLQDFERGRELEIAPLLGAVMALGRSAGVPTPTLDVIAALIGGLDRNARAD